MNERFWNKCSQRILKKKHFLFFLIMYSILKNCISSHKIEFQFIHSVKILNVI